MPNLVGIGNSQVPTNAMLGGLAYQDSVGEIDIEKIKARTSDNAVDIFVYDTRKDSDGGAWRKKATTQSWYNEGASQFRGARKEFPKVAVLVVTNNSDSTPSTVVIYDGDDPNLPMWIKYERDSTQDPFLDYSTPGSHHLGNYEPTSVSALNGIICVGTYRSAGHISNLNAGLREFHLIEDTCFATNNDKRVQLPTNTADRQVVTVYYKQRGIQKIVNSNVNDVAMTVLPNAPIDASTGLPVPTIAVATDGGTSIIRDDGNVFDIVYTSSPNTRYVDFRKSDNAIVMSMDSNASYVHVIYNIPSSDISGSHQYQKEGIDDEFYRTHSSSDWNQEVWIAGLSPFGDSVRIADNIIAGNRGINVLSPSRTAAATDTMVANIRYSFNTGYMHGDIQGAFLSDTDTTNIADTQLITNYDFTNGITGWTTQLNGASGGSPGITVSSNKLVFQQGTSNSVWLVAYQTITTVVGKRYLLDINIASTNTAANWRVYAASTKVLGYPSYLNQGSHTAEFVATSTSTMIQIQQGGAANTAGEVNSLSVRLMEHDLSVKNTAITVYGTIVKAPVATGAELVAYGPFSGSNFFRQSPNSSMNIGTGDAYEMIWFKTTTGSGTRMLISYEGGANGTTAYGKPFNIRYESGVVRGWASHDNFSTYDDVSHGVSTADGYWHCAAWVKRGQMFELYVDGEFIGSDTGAVGSNALSDANSELVIGARKRGKVPTATDHEESFDGYLALARIGKTAPSPEQIRKIYNDEKYLFHENAKCTLYGTSDAVTGLAFDDTNDVLHVGTSSGRSEFRGLNRINNTTTAVTTAISASNELVAEQ